MVAPGRNRLRKAETPEGTVTLGSQVFKMLRKPNIGSANIGARSIFKGSNSIKPASSTEPDGNQKNEVNLHNNDFVKLSPEHQTNARIAETGESGSEVTTQEKDLTLGTNLGEIAGLGLLRSEVTPGKKDLTTATDGFSIRKTGRLRFEVKKT